MDFDDGMSSRYLAEWYVPQTLDRVVIAEVVRSVRRVLADTPTAAHPPHLLYALEIPDDAYAFGVFSADSADAVAKVCEQVGHPADRVSAAIDAFEEPPD